MGDDAVLHALRGDAFAAFRDRDERGRAKLDQVLEACRRDSLLETLEAGWDLASDLADTSIDDRLEGDTLEAWEELKTALLATDACPWFGRLCEARDVLGGAVPPDALSRLATRLRETGLLATLGPALEADDLPNGFVELDAFLGRAAEAGAWVLWHSR